MRRVWSLHVFSTAICSFRLATSRFTTWLCFRNITALSCVTFLRFIPFTCGRKINWRYFTESPRVQLRSGEYFIEKVTSLNSSHLTGRALVKGTRKWMQVNASFRLAFNLRFVWTCASRALALTLVELKFVRKSTQVFHRLAIQRKSTQVTDHKSTVYDWNLPPIASPYASSGFVNLRWLELLTCLELRVHLARAQVNWTKYRSMQRKRRLLKFQWA